MKKSLLLLTCLCIGVFSLTACGGKKDSTNTLAYQESLRKAQTETSTVAETPAATETPAPVETPAAVETPAPEVAETAYVEPGGGETGAYSDGQTAPMPEQVSTLEDIVGKWVDDPNATQPHIYEFWLEGDQLMYTHYQISPGDANGIGTSKTYTEFEYRSGKATLMGHWGVVDCWEADDTSYSSFYHDPQTQTLVDAVDGQTTYYKMDDFEYTLK